MSQLALVLLLLATAALTSPPRLGVQSGQKNAVPVELALTVVRGTARVGEAPARVRVELRNNGKTDFIVGEDLLPIVNASTYLMVEVTDSEGHKGPLGVTAADMSFSVRNASWTRIAPLHYYGIELDLDTRDYPALGRPGRYSLRAKYVSEGGTTPPSPEWQVPSFEVWKGEITSNTVTIDVLPKL